MVREAREAVTHPIVFHSVTSFALRHSVFTCVALLLTGAFCGCESWSDLSAGVREKFEARNEGRTKLFSADARATFEAVRVSAAQMGYRILRAGAAQGNLEAVSGVGQGESMGSARQVSMRVQLRATEAGGGTEVNVRFTEVIEDDSSNRPGQATETPLRDTPQYEVFFRNVQQVLDTAAATIR